MATPHPVRSGGHEIDGRFVYELTGGALALDFVNTLDERRASPKERLTNYGRLVDWAVQTDALTDGQAASLLADASLHPVEAARVLSAAVDLRAALFSILEALVHEGGVSDGLLETLNPWVALASGQRRLVGLSDGPAWSFTTGAGALDAMLWPIVESAAAILVSPDLRRRLRLCSGPTCAWAFLDYSRKQNRRWCDMSVCGNRAKVRRHYARSRSQPSS